MSIEKLYKNYGLTSSRDFAYTTGKPHDKITREIKTMAKKYDIPIITFDEEALVDPRINADPLNPIIYYQIYEPKVKNLKAAEDYFLNHTAAAILEIKYDNLKIIDLIKKAASLAQENNVIKKLNQNLKDKIANTNQLSIIAPNGDISILSLHQVISQKVFDVKDDEIYQTLRDHQYLEDNNLKPTQKAINENILRIIHNSNDPEDFATLVTQKGQNKYINYYKEIAANWINVANNIEFVNIT